MKAADFAKPDTSLAKALHKLQAKIVYLKRQYARMQDIQRKQDTRRKIQLGGLVKKAKLDQEPTAVLLGLLLEAAEKLESKTAQQQRQDWKLRGDIALTRDQRTM